MKKIEVIKNKKEPVKVCGNNGSYKIYESNSLNLLSHEKIQQIPLKYKALSDLGYSNE